jgi:hypothetical protein
MDRAIERYTATTSFAVYGATVCASRHDHYPRHAQHPRGTRIVNLDEVKRSVATLLDDLAVRPLMHFFHALSQGDRRVLIVLLVASAALGFVIGRRRTNPVKSRRGLGAWRFPKFQNSGEGRVSRVLLGHFGPPDYHLMNHVTLQMDDGTTQVDHILVSRFGVFVVETKDYNGWIFANPSDEFWTQVLYQRKSRFQNPIFQNKRHVRAVRGLLSFLPSDAIRSVVVFAGDAEFKTDIPDGIVVIGQLADVLRSQTAVSMSTEQFQLCVGRLETARLAISRETDVEHIQNLARRHRPAVWSSSR